MTDYHIRHIRHIRLFQAAYKDPGFATAYALDLI
jgi:hypothetical protein